MSTKPSKPLSTTITAPSDIGLLIVVITQLSIITPLVYEKFARDIGINSAKAATHRCQHLRLKMEQEAGVEMVRKRGAAGGKNKKEEEEGEGAEEPTKGKG